jgi:hypothetical protein
MKLGKIRKGRQQGAPARRGAALRARLPLLALLLLPLAMLGLCLGAGAELEAALAAWLGCMDPGSRALLLAPLMLAALSLPPLCALAVLLRPGRRCPHCRDFLTDEGKS